MKCAFSEHYFWLGALLLWVAACGGAPTGEVRTQASRSVSALVTRLHYSIRFAEGLERATIEGCSDKRDPSWTYGNQRRLRELSVETFERAEGGCIRTKLDLTQERGGRAMTRGSGGLSLSTAALLQRPERVSSQVRISLKVEVPKHFHLLAPWPGEGSRFETDLRALRFDGLLAISERPPIVSQAAGVRIKTHVFSDSFAPADAWVRRGVETIAELWGHVPFTELHVIVVPVASTRPVRFGFATRGPIGTVLVMPSAEASLEELLRDWVLPHELCHLLFPYIEDAWLSEGLATYYQEVLRARSSAIDVSRAWSNLASGFARGAASAGDAPLGQQSANMRENGSFVRVYWSGAALVFLLDVELREVGSSLDQALQAVFTEDDYQGTLDAAQILARLDKNQAGVNAQQLSQTWLASKRFPPAKQVLKRFFPRARSPQAREMASAIMSKKSASTP